VLSTHPVAARIRTQMPMEWNALERRKRVGGESRRRCVIFGEGKWTAAAGGSESDADVEKLQLLWGIGESDTSEGEWAGYFQVSTVCLLPIRLCGSDGPEQIARTCQPFLVKPFLCH
jgi:hypothetical protein